MTNTSFGFQSRLVWNNKTIQPKAMLGILNACIQHIGQTCVLLPTMCVTGDRYQWSASIESNKNKSKHLCNWWWSPLIPRMDSRQHSSTVSNPATINHTLRIVVVVVVVGSQLLLSAIIISTPCLVRSTKDRMINGTMGYVSRSVWPTFLTTCPVISSADSLTDFQ